MELEFCRSLTYTSTLGRLIMMKNLKQRNPSQVLPSHTERNKGGKVRMSTMVAVVDRKVVKCSAATNLRRKCRRKMIPRAKSICNMLTRVWLVKYPLQPVLSDCLPMIHTPLVTHYPCPSDILARNIL